MDREFKTSFIPKKPMNQETTFERPKSVNLLSFIATVIFVASLIAAGGSYFYKTTLATSVKQKSAMLESAKANFDAETVLSIQELNKRINASKEILTGHIIVSPIFAVLQDQTLKSVSFTKFDYTFDPTSGRVNVDMIGKATGYDAIALQSDELVKNKYIKDPVFSNLNLDDKGRVTFDLSFYVDPTLVNFEDVLAREGNTPALPDTQATSLQNPLTPPTITNQVTQ